MHRGSKIEVAKPEEVEPAGDDGVRLLQEDRSLRGTSGVDARKLGSGETRERERRRRRNQAGSVAPWPHPDSLRDDPEGLDPSAGQLGGTTEKPLHPAQARGWLEASDLTSAAPDIPPPAQPVPGGDEDRPLHRETPDDSPARLFAACSPGEKGPEAGSSCSDDQCPAERWRGCEGRSEHAGGHSEQGIWSRQTEQFVADERAPQGISPRQQDP